MATTLTPVYASAFVGRAKELADIRARLADPGCRLLTLTGLGGSGKTRLAIEATLSPRDNTGSDREVVFVPLQALASSDQLVSAIAQAVGIHLVGEENAEHRLLNALRPRSLILLLDNFEHLLSGAPLVSAIVTEAPGIAMLVTSREPLDLREEWLYPVQGLSTPPSVYLQSLTDYDAAQLFLENARRFQPDFDLEAEHDAVYRICRQTAGVPLAIELAASWLRGLSARQIADEVQRGLAFLTTSTRNVAERHRNMRAVFEQSWALLSDVERNVFARLSVFRGGFDAAAAFAVTGAPLLLLGGLVGKSLLQRHINERYTIHELLRQFGADKLAEIDPEQLTDTAHARYFANYMLAREIDLKGRNQIGALDAIEQDFDNFHAAWEWALRSGEHALLRNMSEGLCWYATIRTRQQSVSLLYSHALEQLSTDGAARSLWASIQARQCFLLMFDLPIATVIERMDASLAILAQSADESEAAICSVMYAYFLGQVAQRNFARARQLADQALAHFQRIGDQFYVAQVLSAFCASYFYQGDRVESMQSARECAQIRRAIGDRYGTARIVLTMGAEAFSIPDFEKAEILNREANEIWRSLDSWGYVSVVDVNLAYLAIFRGDLPAARAVAEEALALARGVSIGDHIAYALAISGVVASIQERYTDAWQMLMEAQTLALQPHSIEAMEWGIPLAACGLHDYETARQATLHAIRYAQRINATGRYSWKLPATIVLLAQAGRYERAVELLGLILTHPASTPAWMVQWPLLTRLRKTLAASLGDAAYEAAFQRGTTLDLYRVFDESAAWLENEHPVSSSSSSSSSSSAVAATASANGNALPETLTPRELEVLRLLADGLTNPQIAERLFVSAGTVKTHTLNIFRKLNVENRTQAVRRARELGLLI